MTPQQIVNSSSQPSRPQQFAVRNALVRYLPALSLLLTVSSCVLPQRTYGIHGRLTQVDTGRPLPGIEITLVEYVRGFSLLASTRPIGRVTTDATGAFYFSVKPGQDVAYIDIGEWDGDISGSLSVSRKQVVHDQLRVEASFKYDHIYAIRWNDGEWVKTPGADYVPWPPKEPRQPSIVLPRRPSDPVDSP